MVAAAALAAASVALPWPSALVPVASVWAQSSSSTPAQPRAAAGARRAAPAAAPAAASGPTAAQLAAEQAQRQRFQTECLACHGEGGQSQQPEVPSLAGQHAFYAITQLFLYREGRRGNPVMSAVAKGMSDSDMRAFSELIAALPVAPVAGGGADADPVRMRRGAELAVRHRCASCHGSDYAGGAQVARIAGQREDYLRLVLKEFQSGARLGYTTAMNETLSGLSPDDLGDLAHFLARVR
ncbi:MAG: c-type cytochrome [Betaproteobacteria bacterium]|nr:c-type cytochrome [Betaproteobacteria bacterium]